MPDSRLDDRLISPRVRATMMIDMHWTLDNDPQHEARLIWEKIALV
jgi:transposase